MKNIFLVGISSLWTLTSHACFMAYNFYLDTSAQNYTVIINKPFFATSGEYDFNKYVQCTSSTGNYPIKIWGMSSAFYQCTQSNPLDLQPNSEAIISNTIEIDANNQSILIPDPDYPYAPWDTSGKQYSHTYLIYFDNNEKLAYRPI